MQVPPASYLYNDVDRVARDSLYLLVEDKDAEFCKDRAEEFFLRQNIDMALYSIALAVSKDPNRLHFYHLHGKAYLVHKLATKVNNWYVVLGIKDHTAPIEEIEQVYNRTAFILHPYLCPSLAAKSAWIYINIAWYVLSDPTKRAAHDKHLLTQIEFLDYANASFLSSESYHESCEYKFKRSSKRRRLG